MKKIIISTLILTVMLLSVIVAAVMPAAAADAAPQDAITLTSSGDLAAALNTIADGGTITVSGTYAVPSNFPWPTYDKDVTITGGTLDLTGMGTVAFNGNVTFENLTLTISSTVYANGHKVKIADTVTLTNTVSAIYGGSNGGTVASTDLTLLSGTYNKIYGGSNGGTVTGDTHVSVGGTVNPNATIVNHGENHYVYGGSNGGTVNGNTYLTFGGNAKMIHIFGGSYRGVINGTTNVYFTGGASMSIYAGTNGEGKPDSSVNIKQVNLTMTGGTVEQILGACNGTNMVGDVNLYILGGTVTRRIYGGCYNEAVRDGYSLAWNSTYAVTGSIVLTLDDAATITFTKDGYADHAIFARSRYQSKRDYEKGTIIYTSSTAQTKFKNLLGYNQLYFGLSGVNAEDTGFALYMNSLSATDETHIMTYTSSGATITETCSLCSTVHSATATLSIDQNSNFIYTGEPITPPAEITYTDGWKSGKCVAVTYLNNINAGTASATASYINATASLNFTIEKASQAAPAGLSKTDETFAGKADGTISGLTTAMEISSDGGSTYTKVTDVNMTFAAGTYLIRVAETDNYKASDAASLTIAAGRQLAVTFKADGSTVVTKYVNYNGALSNADIPDIPTKIGYTQTAPVWSVTDFSAITADLEVNAVYTVNKYTVTFKVDGNPYATKTVEHGAALSDIPAVPDRPGHTGVWSVADFSNITTDLEVNATYTIKKYTVVFMDGNTVVDRFENLDYGSSLSPQDIPAVPTKAGHSSKWDMTDFSNITADLTVNAVHTIFTYTVTLPAETVSYTVTATDKNPKYHDTLTLTLSLSAGYSKVNGQFAFQVNGEPVTLTGNQYVIQAVEQDITVTVVGIADITAPAGEIKFSSVSPNLIYKNPPSVQIIGSDAGSGIANVLYYISGTALTEDAIEDIVDWLTYTEQFTLPANRTSYVYAKLTDNAGNVTVLSSGAVLCDSITPTVTGIPQSNIHYGNLEFTVSDANLTTVTIDSTPRALAERYTITADNGLHSVVVTDAAGNTVRYTFYVRKIYTVTFMVGNEAVGTRTVNHGSSVTDAPEIPAREGYTGKWDKSLSNVQSDLTVTAVYTINKYTVTFKVDGETYATKQVDWNTDLTDIPTIPTKDGYTQTAPKWVLESNSTDAVFTSITADMTVVALYTINTYDITFTANGNETVKTVEHGAALSDIPTIASKEGYTQIAPKWVLESNGADAVFTNITADMTVVALYTINTYTVTFKVDGETYSTKQVEWNTDLTAIPTVPTKIGYTNTAPKWIVNGVGADFTDITADLTVDALYTVNTYTVTFKNGDTVIKTLTVEHGAALANADIPAVPTKDGHTAKWDQSDFQGITADLTVSAVYTPIAAPEQGDQSQSGNAENDVNAPADAPNADTEGGSSAVVIIVIVAACAVAGGTAAAIVIIKKKKKA